MESIFYTTYKPIDTSETPYFFSTATTIDAFIIQLNYNKK